MRIYSFEHHQQPRLGAEINRQLIDLTVAYEASRDPEDLQEKRLSRMPTDLLSLVRLGDLGKQAMAEAFAFACKRRAVPVGEQLLYPVDAVDIRVPIRRPGKVLCFDSGAVGDRDQRRGRWVVKFSSALIATEQAIRKPRGVSQLQCTPHLAAIIGRRMRHISADEALADVFGFTLLNDVSAPDPKVGNPEGIMDRNFDTFCPIGPCVITPEELLPGAGVAGRVTVNGKETAKFVGQNCIDRLGAAIRELSKAMTLEPGDMVATNLFEPGAMMVETGDRIAIEVDRLGMLGNPVTSE